MMKLRFRDNRGAALVELALTTPLLLMIMVGAAELGRIAYAAIEVESAARAGAAWGSVNLANTYCSLSGSCATDEVAQAALDDAPNLSSMTASASTACVCETYTWSTGSASFNPSSGTAACATSTSSTSCDSSTSTSTQSNITYVVVSTQATIDTLFKYPGLPKSITLHGYSEMRILQN